MHSTRPHTGTFTVAYKLNTLLQFQLIILYDKDSKGNGGGAEENSDTRVESETDMATNAPVCNQAKW